MTQVSVVMLNWARRENVYRLVPAYVEHPRVAEVVIWDASRDHALSQDSLPKQVRLIRSAHDFGLTARFAAAGLCQTDGILFVDDDISVGPSVLEAVVANWMTKPASVHGLFGRNPPVQDYNIINCLGPVEVVLTRFCAAPRQACCQALWHATEMAKVLGGVPFGNGEDIVLSYTAMAMSGMKNQASQHPYVNYGYNDRNAISVRYKQHTEHRAAVVDWCRRRLLAK